MHSEQKGQPTEELPTVGVGVSRSRWSSDMSRITTAGQAAHGVSVETHMVSTNTVGVESGRRKRTRSLTPDSRPGGTVQAARRALPVNGDGSHVVD